MATSIIGRQPKKEENKRQKQKEKTLNDYEDHKLEIRLLPPSLTEADFRTQLSEYWSKPIENQNIYYVQGSDQDNTFKLPVYSRAYLSFHRDDDLKEFAKSIDGRPFAEPLTNDNLVPKLEKSFHPRMPHDNVIEQPGEFALEKNLFFEKFKQILEPVYNGPDFSILRIERLEKKRSKQKAKKKLNKQSNNSKEEGHGDVKKTKDQDSKPKKKKHAKGEDVTVEQNSKPNAIENSTDASESTLKKKKKPKKSKAKKVMANETPQNPTETAKIKDSKTAKGKNISNQDVEEKGTNTLETVEKGKSSLNGATKNLNENDKQEQTKDIKKKKRKQKAETNPNHDQQIEGSKANNPVKQSKKAKSRPSKAKKNTAGSTGTTTNTTTSNTTGTTTDNTTGTTTSAITGTTKSTTN